jgi:hypothetical protein
VDCSGGPGGCSILAAHRLLSVLATFCLPALWSRAETRARYPAGQSGPAYTL